jgi:hypothetical protein
MDNSENKILDLNGYNGNLEISTPQLWEKFEEYLNSCTENSTLPTIEGYVLHLGATRYSFEKVRQQSEELRRQCDRILLLQKEKLVQGGLVARNSRFHEFLLGAVHKMYKTEEGKKKDTDNLNFENPELMQRLERIEKKLTRKKEIIEDVDFETIDDE